ncbi:MAG: ABC-2 family transporter protein [Oscillospiraceae bacterium]|jgi:ABC-2 type transport system permease protein|nr:ABC-2 family transporter protein [Oscillospiraceae bacterium]
MKYYLRLGMTYWKMHLKKTFMFKQSFIINRIVQALNYFVEFALIWIMVNAFENMNGWNQYEVMLLYATNIVGYSIAAFFLYRTMLSTSTEVQNGAFDDVLTKPVRTLPYMCFRNLNPDYIAHVTLAAVMYVVAFSRLGVHIGIAEIAKLLLAFVCGGLVYGGMFLLAIAPTFILRETRFLRNIIFLLRDMSYYPISVFPLIIQVIMTLVLPYAVISFFPVQALIGKQDYLFLGRAIIYIAPLIATAFFAVGLWLFGFCVKRYKSTGS